MLRVSILQYIHKIVPDPQKHLKNCIFYRFLGFHRIFYERGIFWWPWKKFFEPYNWSSLPKKNFMSIGLLVLKILMVGTPHPQKTPIIEGGVRAYLRLNQDRSQHVNWICTYKFEKFGTFHDYIKIWNTFKPGGYRWGTGGDDVLVDSMKTKYIPKTRGVPGGYVQISSIGSILNLQTV